MVINENCKNCQIRRNLNKYPADFGKDDCLAPSAPDDLEPERQPAVQGEEPAERGCGRLQDFGTLSPTCRPTSLDCAKAFPHRASSAQIITSFFFIIAHFLSNSEPFPFQLNIKWAGKKEGNVPETGTLPAVGAWGLKPRWPITFPPS